MTDPRTSAQAKVTEERLLKTMAQILAQKEHELLECREELAMLRRQVGYVRRGHEGM